jgi:hypothetical protein
MLCSHVNVVMRVPAAAAALRRRTVYPPLPHAPPPHSYSSLFFRLPTPTPIDRIPVAFLMAPCGGSWLGGLLSKTPHPRPCTRSWPSLWLSTAMPFLATRHVLLTVIGDRLLDLSRKFDPFVPRPHLACPLAPSLPFGSYDVDALRSAPFSLLIFTSPHPTLRTHHA